MPFVPTPDQCKECKAQLKWEKLEPAPTEDYYISECSWCGYIHLSYPGREDSHVKEKQP